MQADRLRIVWPLLCGALAIALGASLLHSRKKLEALSERARKREAKATRAAQPRRDKHHEAYLQELAATLHYDAQHPPSAADAARLAAYLNLERNKDQMLARQSGGTTFRGRDLEFAHRLAQPLSALRRIELPTAFTHYKYELINRGERTLAAPILFQAHRWDSAPDLVASAGFKSIASETERAIAIWRFLCQHRRHAKPVTEGADEHDVIKYLSLYGYGFCDDTARAMAALAELSGLRSRVWALEGHVVSEVFADGRWRMFDADLQAYFHRPDKLAAIYGLEELATNRRAFACMVSNRLGESYPAPYIDYFLSREDNTVIPSGTSGYRIRPVLRPGERMVFTNYNWGRYFLGKYPQGVPFFCNGWFEHVLTASDLTLSGGLVLEPMEGGCRLRNRGSEPTRAEVRFHSPFPIVGGEITGTATLEHGEVKLRLEDAEHGRQTERVLSPVTKISLDRFVSVLTPSPTYRYSLAFVLEPGAVVVLRDFKVISDFQFAPFALLPLQPGDNEFRVHLPDGSDPAAFELVVSTR